MRQYALITATYWAFTLTDGALRMLVVLHFHGLGFGPLEIASLFLFYEVFGIVTNLFGGLLAARIGLGFSLVLGLVLQIFALSMLLVETALASIAYVMIAQAMSGIAKDLNKMSAKSAVKLVVADEQNALYRWVAALTGSKNALKGVGFFIGGALLSAFGFNDAILAMVVFLSCVFVLMIFGIELKLGQSSFKPKFTEILSKSEAVTGLSMARFFLFGARDVWFVVALPVYLQVALNWSSLQVGTLLAIWIIFYGVVQTLAPRITKVGQRSSLDGKLVFSWGISLAVVPALIALGMTIGVSAQNLLVIGLMIFGAIFAINSAVHSYLIVAYAQKDGVSLDVGFYYMSNAAGRLVGTLLSGAVFQYFGIEWCLLISSIMVAVAALLSYRLPPAGGINMRGETV